MYKPPGAKQAVDKKGTGKHDVSIEPNGQLIFSGAFHGDSNLISSTLDTYFEVHWLAETQEIVISFADANQMEEGFVAPNTDEEISTLREKGIFRLKGKDLKIGLMKVIRDGCTDSIIPDEGWRTKFREGDDLFIGKDEETGSKYITLNTSNKKPEQSNSDKETKRKKLKLVKWCKQFMEKPEEFRKTIFKDKDWNDEWQNEFWNMIDKIHGSGSIFLEGATHEDYKVYQAENLKGLASSRGLSVKYDREASTEAERKEQREKIASQ